MVRIREDREIDFTYYTIFEMVQAFRIDSIKSRSNYWKYNWWRLDYRKKLIKALQKKMDKRFTRF